MVREKLRPEECFYEGIADRFDDIASQYDTQRRVQVVFGELLADVALRGKAVLDAGSGTGWFSAAACERGAKVVALDVGPALLAQVAEKCRCERVVGDLLHLPFGDGAFDVVVCTEVIEHTADPRRAIGELLRVVKPGGALAVTVPNRVWKPSLWIANALGLRPYQGFENWVGPLQLRNWIVEAGGRVARRTGVHLFPFVFTPTHGLLRFADRFGSVLFPVMVNLCFLVQRP